MVRISVIMPVYNAEQYLHEAIDSILNQTYRNFEFLIFNDGSTDNSANIIEQYKDDRIKFFNYAQNSGYVKHLNYGIEIAQGEFIARMDADDISHSARLEKQINLMAANPDVGICGSWYDIIGDSSNIITVATGHDDLKIDLLLNSVFGHPSVMMRAKVLREYGKTYDPDFMPAEDYKMWVELSRVSRLANLAEVLLHYRRHESQISISKQQIQLDRMQSIREMQIEYLLGSKLTMEERRMIFFIFGKPEPAYEKNFFNKALKWVNELVKINTKKKIYLPVKFEKFLQGRIKHLLHFPEYNRSLNYNPSLMFNSGKWLVLAGLSTKDKIKFYLKCLIR